MDHAGATSAASSYVSLVNDAAGPFVVSVVVPPFRQMMYRRIILACSLWLVWSVPSSAKYRSAVNFASMRLNQDAFDGL